MSFENITEDDLHVNEANASSQNESICSDNKEVEVNNTEDQQPTDKQLAATAKSEITPKKALNPKLLQKKQLSEQKKKQKQMEREEREKKKQAEKEEKLKMKMEVQKQKQELEEQKKKEKEEKEEQKRKEREEKEQQKRKEKEEKEQKRKEKEQREELKRKEKEMEKLKKQQEIEEKIKEKQKQEEQKQKAAAAFANFFVPKKSDSITEEKKTISCKAAFMPFEIKSDMRLAPVFRRQLTHEEKDNLNEALSKQQNCVSYLDTIKVKSNIRTSERTWPLEDDDVIVLDDADLGQTICDEKCKPDKMRAKLLKFEENRRPAYFGTWRKVSKCINPRRPFAEDKEFFDYEVDSDDDWEEEEQGESITGSDDEDKENDSENEYEVDNEFFVPHGHLSEDEMDDEENSKLSPESHKAKLKLLKNEFDEEMKCKTQKIKPRVIGCIWYKKNGDVDETIDKFLKPLAIISRGQINILKRSDPIFPSYRKKQTPPLDAQLIPDFLQLVHGNTNKSNILVKEFIAFVNNKDLTISVTKRQLNRQLRELAKWTKCPENGPMLDKHCWYVDVETRKKYGVNLSLPNNWNYITKLVEM